MSPLTADLLRTRARTAGSDPLLTYYDLAAGERTELSGVTFANWVDKTSNLLVEECLLDAGAVVELPLAVSHPGHWVTLVWELACWQVGAVVTVPAPGATAADAALVVAGPDWPTAVRPGVEVVACSLHPLGLGLPAAPPTGVIDFGLEVRSQPDAYAAVPQSGLAPAWRSDGDQLTQADLLSRALAEAGTDREPRRTLLRPRTPWATVSLALLRPLLLGGSSVVVTGPATPGQLDRIAAQERATDPRG
ncbi:MAG: hypothetical protein JWP61_1761 [Friedmanniella sp.]|nr:hypothetical protein [Friedmanniella sp.]